MISALTQKFERANAKQYIKELEERITNCNLYPFGSEFQCLHTNIMFSFGSKFRVAVVGSPLEQQSKQHQSQLVATADLGKAPCSTNWSTTPVAFYHMHAPGINMEGVCNAPRCEARGCYVTCKMMDSLEPNKNKHEQTWKFGEGNLVVTCKACGSIMNNVAPSFNNCLYKIVGVKYNGQRIDTEWQQVGNCLARWEIIQPKRNGWSGWSGGSDGISAQWQELEIKVKM